ncbi:MAG TPA: 23S rRNA (pseudouridine(1915)-N(3))-methyltransferase RlmH [Candidatus Saccharicenans sp.]|jgi:23S rRNA (pseudouridine1915-N3)-methyltransferase|nr:23S rRNA (pseudouridine(1915)-N(3))-methyltransferase RlmH [Candidatus Saccharicenans sp.]HRD02816.1 23S rRNA (pseudouridine(1915)-N(3))-methyltransferase RlmH [Candidatus Saccharicenans sp.]
MKILFVWPGKTRNASQRALQHEYLQKIKPLAQASLIETQEARGLEEKWAEKILEKEARGLEKYTKDGYIICLSDEGKELNSKGLADLIESKGLNSGKQLVFLVGGFLGLAPRIMEKADLKLSLSKMTFSHELARTVLLEQVYRALSLIKGYAYPK